jgi:hypothetical protein
MSAFSEIMPSFEAFLMRAKEDLTLAPGRGGVPQNTCLIPQNFLIEERLERSRVESYAAIMSSTGPANFNEWETLHKDYLGEHVFCGDRPPAHNYHFVERDNPIVCPETFRTSEALCAFQETDLHTELIRLVQVPDISAILNLREEEDIFSLGEQVVADKRHDNPAWQKLSLIFREAQMLSDYRPVFAAFYEDFLDELRDQANTSWADQLRDRVGLYHINQDQIGGLPRRVFLFQYKVQELPHHTEAAARNRRPLAVPVVLDHRLSEAFCPAPRELDRGRVLNLKENAPEVPAREILHLFMPLQVEHLVRVGFVTTPVPDDLSKARRDHLLWLQLLAERKDYGII